MTFDDDNDDDNARMFRDGTKREGRQEQEF